MRRENPPSVRLGLVPTLAAAFLALSLQACLKPTSVDCGPDLTCPAGYGCSANKQECIKGNCGDGIIQEGEACDDGNQKDGDGCNSTCESNETCDNGFVDAIKGEVCDDGNNAEPGGCSVGCRSKETCGNGIIDSGEQCDDDNASEDDNCLNDCTPATCGDGHVDRQDPRIEACDTGGESPTCNLNCTLAVKGDGITNTAAGEQCDSGGVNTATCDSDYTFPQCGDGHHNPEAGESCDTGGESPTCNFNCTRAIKGDGITNTAAGEQCDSWGVNTATCDSDYTFPKCGDGHLNKEAGEQCDEGFVEACGTCDASCKHTPLSAATGSMIVVEGKYFYEGELLILDDGRNPAVVFEFDSNESIPPEHFSIKYSDKYSTRMVAESITNAINDFEGELNIKATVQPDASILLTNEEMGAFGNQPIIETALDRDFKVEGMSGGAGRDCKKDARCTSHENCEYGLKCSEGRCLPSE